jgi:phospholipase/carboxylesterase
MSGLRRATPLAGVVGFSGMLAAARGARRPRSRSRPPVLLLHGDSDEMLPAVSSHERAAAGAACQHGVELRRAHRARASATASTRPACPIAARFLLDAFNLPVPQGNDRDA